jgi:hypothetical protein
MSARRRDGLLANSPIQDLARTRAVVSGSSHWSTGAWVLFAGSGKRNSIGAIEKGRMPDFWSGMPTKNCRRMGLEKFVCSRASPSQLTNVSKSAGPFLGHFSSSEGQPQDTGSTAVRFDTSVGHYCRTIHPPMEAKRCSVLPLGTNLIGSIKAGNGKGTEQRRFASLFAPCGPIFVRTGKGRVPQTAAICIRDRAHLDGEA